MVNNVLKFPEDLNLCQKRNEVKPNYKSQNFLRYFKLSKFENKKNRRLFRK